MEYPKLGVKKGQNKQKLTLYLALAFGSILKLFFRFRAGACRAACQII